MEQKLRKSVTVAELQARLGATETAAPASHRMEAEGVSTAVRTAAGTLAGSALVGAAALASAPAAAAAPAPAPFALPSADQVAESVDQIREAASAFGIALPEIQIQGDLPPELVPYKNALEGKTASTPHAPAFGPITSGFGPRWGTFHNGTDFGAPIGAPIYAVEDATVVNAGPASGYGLWVRLLTDDGHILEYGHNNRNFVTVGQRVSAGQVIAEVGNRGFSTGPHLHFGVRTPAGQWVDPVPFLAQRGVNV